MKKFEFRPWGWYLTLDEDSAYKVKRIYVKPNEQFSLQYHNDREEYWTVLEGDGTITQGEEERPIAPGDCAYTPKEQIHRLHGGDKGIYFVEVQRGVCKEDDIVRLKDDYGRI